MNIPTGGYFLWLEFESTFDANKLYHFALERGVSIAPGSMFSTSSQFNHAFRLNSSFQWNSRTEKGIEIIGEGCRKLRRK